MATRRSVPRRPTAADVAAMTAGPKRKRIAMVRAATLFPQAMILGCTAMKSPGQAAKELLQDMIATNMCVLLVGKTWR